MICSAPWSGALPKQPLRSTSSQMPAQDPAANSQLNSLRVLVVEDEWLVSMEIESALEEGGYECVGIAVSAEEAIELARTLRPQLVLMDIRLKGDIDGVQAADELNKRHGLRCLFISAHADAQTKERASGANPIGWLPKPFSAPQLIQTLEAAKLKLHRQ